jgi:hypothetical protein
MTSHLANVDPLKLRLGPNTLPDDEIVQPRDEPEPDVSQAIEPEDVDREPDEDIDVAL